MCDISKLRDAYTAATDEEQAEGFGVYDLEIFENVAYIMARHADPSIPAEIDDWLEQFNVFSIYHVLPEILNLWALNEETLAESKKKLTQVAAN